MNLEYRATFGKSRDIELDLMYTTEEYQQLVNILSKKSILGLRLKQFLDKKQIYIVDHEKSFVYKSISEYISGFSPPAYEVMYYAYFNDLALYVNNKDVTCNAALKWRLFINR
jgi:hypothetical protein